MLEKATKTEDKRMLRLRACLAPARGALYHTGPGVWGHQPLVEVEGARGVGEEVDRARVESSNAWRLVEAYRRWPGVDNCADSRCKDKSKKLWVVVLVWSIPHPQTRPQVRRPQPCGGAQPPGARGGGGQVGAGHNIPYFFQMFISP